ncbi:uncharacterized protein E0L32_004151 [Thyridium curvatum]|uniref:Phytanoyl-CoA dioxygenase n=1 Tax=Thyridium curvatum TaxID=1093900 RepID=A0A507BAC4_9PEZI|nr:uncharacterized protein E0L32_004151 [Thyridium curvatum]TPX16156.1 hypothetical protein E0L32_004151 [Thyridium curvatum]
MPSKTDAPVVIRLSDEERDSGSLTDHHLYDAVEAFFNDGFVVLENAVHDDLIDKLNDRMLQDTQKLLAGHGLSHYAPLNNKVAEKGAAAGGNLSQVPPLEKEWLFPEVFANKHAAQVISYILGPRPEVHFLRSNTLLKNDDRQRVHSDMRFEHPTHPFAITQNVCLCDCGPENGMTELWLGTQNTGVEIRPQLGEPFIEETVVEERRKVRPPLYPRVKKGSILVRDLRLWHAGMPNPSDQVRILLTINYYAGWFKNGALVSFPESLRPHVEELERYANIKIAANYEPDEGYDYLNSKFSNNFSSVLHPEAWEKIAHVKTAKGY